MTGFVGSSRLAVGAILVGFAALLSSQLAGPTAHDIVADRAFSPDWARWIASLAGGITLVLAGLHVTATTRSWRVPRRLETAVLAAAAVAVLAVILVWLGPQTSIR